MKCLLCVRHHDGGGLHEVGSVISPILQGENRGSERYSLLLKVTQLLSEAEVF